MRYARYIYLLLGLALLTWYLATQIDLEASLKHVADVGWGILLILAIFSATFMIDSLNWKLTLVSRPNNFKWYGRFLRVRMAGESMNLMMASVGGEPFKAILLRQSYGVPYKDGIASLILVKTITVLTMLVFMGAGLVLFLQIPDMPTEAKIASGVGFVLLGFGIAGFFIVQRFKVTSKIGHRLGKTKIGRRIADRLTEMADLEDRLVYFYTRHRPRFTAAMCMAMLAWLIGVVETYVAMALLGFEVTWKEAFIIESVTQLARAGAFFIPLQLGAQDLAMAGISVAVGGATNPAGVAFAILRRIRDLSMIIAGWLVGVYLFRRVGEAADSENI